ncbi:MAG: hypothetical protein GF368_04435 [Candidatus Aenigmarchaeota archaeon]|nr:hypothetical protein [Candidatus Aenigmarchaeota archaeon]
MPYALVLFQGRKFEPSGDTAPFPSLYVWCQYSTTDSELGEHLTKTTTSGLNLFNRRPTHLRRDLQSEEEMEEFERTVLNPVIKGGFYVSENIW